MTTDKLQPCRACGAPCRIERFEGSHIEGVMTIYMCANSTKFGGDCPDPHAYLNINAWNTRTNSLASQDAPDEAVVKRVAAILELPENEFRTDEPLSLQRAYRIAQAIVSKAPNSVEEERELAIIAEAFPPKPKCDVDRRFRPGETLNEYFARNGTPVDPNVVAEYERSMREDTIPAIERDIKAQQRAAHFLRLGIPDPEAPNSDLLEEAIGAHGEALFVLSDRLRASGVISSSDAVHQAYERVVATYQSLARLRPEQEDYDGIVQVEDE
jgi:hypothetical protein